MDGCVSLTLLALQPMNNDGCPGPYVEETFSNYNNYRIVHSVRVWSL